jgi:hypothetical protein
MEEEEEEERLKKTPGTSGKERERERERVQRGPLKKKPQSSLRTRSTITFRHETPKERHASAQ